ncbi:MAG TPA: hypothetical protein VFV73_18680 [Streptosporangiaceae bacterium]|nr:hypothetical protein [Streptosporangiaceae bacterium]
MAAIVAGVALNRPARKAPWLLLAVAQLSVVAGQLSFPVAGLLGTQLPFPSFADVLYLATYPMYAVALLIFIRWRIPARDRRSLIDALTLTAGLGLLSWIYLILPYTNNPDLSWLQKSVAVGYPLCDVLVLAVVARLLGHLADEGGVRLQPGRPPRLVRQQDPRLRPGQRQRDRGPGDALQVVPAGRDQRVEPAFRARTVRSVRGL